jgi:hypothetical protein
MTGLVEDPSTDFADDRRGLLGEWDERCGHEESEGRVTPADQGLDGHEPAVSEVNFRKVVYFERPVGDGSAQVASDLGSCPAGCQHLLVEEDHLPWR